MLLSCVCIIHGLISLPTSINTRTLSISGRFNRHLSYTHGTMTLDMNRLNIHDILDSTSNHLKKSSPIWKTTLASIAILTASLFSTPFHELPISNAADTAKVGLCLLQSCQKELLQCVLNPKCFANIICLNTCNSNDGVKEANCQIRCGDLFENDVVGVFNTCAVSQKKCVPRKYTPELYPPANPDSLVKTFDMKTWNGRWYITAGLNKAFDIFDCQVHFFNSPTPDKMYAKINWRVTEPDEEFFTKNAIQKFMQDPKNPAHLINHDNEYLHYEDDWYIIDYEPNDFVLVYYQGRNDAWEGYGGAFLCKLPSYVFNINQHH